MKQGIDVTQLQSQFAAQPIFDSDKKRVAVELLCRDHAAASALTLDLADTAGLDSLSEQIMACVEPYRASLFIRLSPEFVLSATKLPLMPAKVVLALATPASASPELLAAIKHYKAQGFRYLLDDACTDNDSPELIALADIIRIDMAGTNLADIERHKALYSRPGLQWLAAHVETDAKFAIYKTLGCDLFQGYFLPDKLIVAGKKIEPSALKLSEIIACLFAEEPDINLLAELLRHEPTIVMALLKIANSPLYRKTRAVGTVKEMVTRLGLALARKWVMTYAVLGGSTSAAVTTVLTRADCMQRIAQQWKLNSEQGQQFFLAGLISGTDMLFGIESSVFLAQLNLKTSIKQAINQNSGRMAEALALALSIERGYALGLPASEAELAYQSCYHLALAEVQQHLAEAGY